MKIDSQRTSDETRLTAADTRHLNLLLGESATVCGGEDAANALARKLRDGGRPTPVERKALAILEETAMRVSARTGDRSFRRVGRYLRSARSGWATKPAPTCPDTK